MAEISASQVKALREKTDAPMMECKKALTEAQGDMEKAEEILRVKLGSKASKASSRLAAEGLIAIAPGSNGHGAIVEVNCETDFVAKNDDFVAFAQNVANLIADKQPGDIEALAQLPMNDETVDAVRLKLIGKLGENISIRRFATTTHAGQVAQYLHGGKIGVLLSYEGDATVAKDLAMHIAASKPLALSREGVPADAIAREKSVAEQKAVESGKPADIAAKMVEGSVQKFLKEVALLSQPFVKDDKLTVEQLLKNKQTKLHQFFLYVVGEGIEKKSTDFAAEVAAQAAAARS